LEEEMISKRLIIGFILLGMVLMLYFSPVSRFVTFESLKEQRDYLQELVDTHYFPSVIAYMVLYSIAVAICMPFVALLTMAGGMLFGVIPCVLYTTVSATIGATMAFLVIRYVLGDVIQHAYKRQLVSFNKAVEHYGTHFLLAVHLVVIIPFFIINILAGLTQIRLWTFVWTTAVGIIPGVLLYAYAGKQLGTLEHIKDIFSWNIIIILIILVCLSLLPIIWNYSMKRKIGG
jgi:uncharacterized membrane protein YdjX (TVP38/TMEM64 family)